MKENENNMKAIRRMAASQQKLNFKLGFY